MQKRPEGPGIRMEQKHDAMVIVISAPSGSGKTTVINMLLKEMAGIKRSVSYTTRPPRKDEINNVDYVFVSKEEFEKKLQAGELLEYERIFENHYGTLTKEVEDALAAGEDIILSIDVNGAKEVKKKFPESISIFIMPPSAEELASRLKKRNTEKEDERKLRLRRADLEVEASGEYDYLVINQELVKAVSEIRTIIETERKNRKKTKKNNL